MSMEKPGVEVGSRFAPQHRGLFWGHDAGTLGTGRRSGDTAPLARSDAVPAQPSPASCAKSDVTEPAGDKALISVGANLPIINEHCCPDLLHKGGRGDVSWGFVFRRCF